MLDRDSHPELATELHAATLNAVARAAEKQSIREAKQAVQQDKIDDALNAFTS